MSRPPPGRSARLALSAAGFITTRTSGASPGVMMSWSAKCSWKELTPGRVPVGARISAGKFGSVDRSLPKLAVSLVNRLPVSCLPSPESPASRMTTRSSSTTLFTSPPGAEGTGRSAGSFRRVTAATSAGNDDLAGAVGTGVQRWNNGVKTALLLGLMGGLILTAGALIGGRSGLLIALVIALAVNGY